MKYVIPMIILSLVLLSCSKDENEETTNNALTCTGASSGSGPTIGSVALEEATYLSTCFSGYKIQMEFKNNTSAQYVMWGYGDSSCSGTATSESNGCMESITVSSTTVTKPTYVDGTLGDNVTGYDTTNTWKHNSDTMYLNFSAESTSVFWYNQSSTQAQLDSNTYYLFKFTKQ
jgi:hypothetical protein